MPRTRSLAWAELKIGVVAVVAMILAIMIIVAVGGAGGSLFASRYSLKTKFPDVKGLKSGAVVRVAGVEVGKVSYIEFAGAEVEVGMDVIAEMQQRITTDSRASIGSLSLLGEPVIDISPASAGTPLQDGDFVPAGRAPGQLADVAEGATQTLEQVTLVLRDIRAGKGNLGKLFADDELYREITRFVTAAEQVTGGLNRGQGTLGLMLKDPAAYRRLNTALGDLQQMTARINAGQGSLGRFLKDDEFARALTSTTGNFERITGRLEKGEGTAGKLLTDKELYDRVSSVADRVDTLVAQINQGQGTAGSLLRDKQLYENMNAAASELRALVSDIRKDPRKYLNVRVSIF